LHLVISIIKKLFQKRGIKNTVLRNTHEKKYQSLKKVDDFYRAEITLGKFDLVYQLKLRDLNGSVACFLIKQDSAIFNKLKVGKVLEMKYWTAGKIKIIKFVKAKVTNITKQNQELLNGHYLVDLSYLKDYDQATV
jgi:hypothetical protein